MNHGENSKNMIVTCPHCECLVAISSINCSIFRHAILISTGIQINPHSSKSECEKLIRENKIYGCGKPFKIQQGIAIKCEYI